MAEVNAVLARLSAFTAGVDRHVSIEVRYGKIETEGMSTILDPKADRGDLAGQLKGAYLTSALFQDRFSMREGETRPPRT